MSRDTVLTNQKVLSFSFWGELKSGYFNGIVGNLDLMKTVYPDWVMRLYVSKAKLDNVSIGTICDIQCNRTIGTL